ncbi:MAG: VCBS repeat-containing protein [Myxococcota bacterium]
MRGTSTTTMDTTHRALLAALSLFTACASPPPPTPREPPVASEPPGRRIDAIVSALGEPGCPGLYEMYDPDVQQQISREQHAVLCAELLDQVGPILSVSEPRFEDEWEIYRLTATRDDIILWLSWDEAGRIRRIGSSSDLSAKCEDAIARSGVPARPPAPEPTPGRFTDVSDHALPPCVTARSSMDARPGDIDGDGDLDLIVAVEFGSNLVLINDGHGRFDDQTHERLDTQVHDSEDIGLADLDADGDLDLLFVSEDDQLNQLYVNDGTGVFSEVTERLGGVTGVSNAVIVGDIDGDGDGDVLIGNAGQNEALVNDGAGTFAVETAARLPAASDTTQDLELGDIDGDGDLDLVVGNEDDNRVLVNDGTGVFRDQTEARLPLTPGAEETREVDLGDVDGDGDLDLFFANVAFIEGRDPQNRLLLNDGHGVFVDQTATRLPEDPVGSLDGDLLDLDGDGDLDLVTANWHEDFRAFLNDGTGSFRRDASRLARSARASGVDVEFADFTGDGLPDLYLCNYRDSDRLLAANSRMESDAKAHSVDGGRDPAE